MSRYTSKIALLSALVTVLLLIVSDGAQKVEARAPLVETGISRLAPDGTFVRVNAWPMLMMELETRGPNKGYKMSQSILNGLISMTMDRVVDAAGGQSGPVNVSILGRTVYDNGQGAGAAAQPVVPMIPALPPLTQVA